MKQPSATPTRLRDSGNSGFTVAEVLVALTVIAFVLVATVQLSVSTLRLIGRRDSDYQKGARSRSEAVAWIQAATEYTQKLGFDTLTPACSSFPCSFWIPPTISSAPAPYNQGPALPAAFVCGRVLLSDWDGSGPLTIAQLRLLTVEVYSVRTLCSDSGVGSPFLGAQSAMASR